MSPLEPLLRLEPLSRTASPPELRLPDELRSRLVAPERTFGSSRCLLPEPLSRTSVPLLRLPGLTCSVRLVAVPLVPLRPVFQILVLFWRGSTVLMVRLSEPERSVRTAPSVRLAGAALSPRRVVPTVDSSRPGRPVTGTSPARSPPPAAVCLTFDRASLSRPRTLPSSRMRNPDVPRERASSAMTGWVRTARDSPR